MEDYNKYEALLRLMRDVKDMMDEDGISEDLEVGELRRGERSEQ